MKKNFTLHHTNKNFQVYLHLLPPIVELKREKKIDRISRILWRDFHRKVSLRQINDNYICTMNFQFSIDNILRPYPYFLIE